MKRKNEICRVCDERESYYTTSKLCAPCYQSLRRFSYRSPTELMESRARAERTLRRISTVSGSNILKFRKRKAS